MLRTIGASAVSSPDNGAKLVSSVAWLCLLLLLSRISIVTKWDNWQYRVEQMMSQTMVPSLFQVLLLTACWHFCPNTCLCVWNWHTLTMSQSETTDNIKWDRMMILRAPSLLQVLLDRSIYAHSCFCLELANRHWQYSLEIHWLGIWDTSLSVTWYLLA